MVRKFLPLVILGASVVAVAQNAPPAGGPPGGARMDPAERFKMLDKNNDGKLSMEEFSAMQMRAGGSGGPPGAAGNAPPATSAADRFKAMDKSNDGSISLEEFTQGMQAMRPGGGPPGQ